MEKNKLYLTTGEFAKLCNTSKHTLFHYYNIGLFFPHYTDKKGYRYYNILQYDTFLTIRQLKTIGMSLTEIKGYLSERSPQKMLELYNNQEELLNIQINSLKIIKQRIHSKRRNIEQALLCGHDFLIESVKEEYLFCSDEIFNINDFEMTYVFGNLIKTSAEKLLPNIYGMISKTDNAVKDIVPLRFYIHTTLKSDNSMIVKPSGKYLTTFHTGDYSTLQTTYKKVLSYAEKHNIILYEWFYTETIIGDWAVCSPQEYIIKVSIQINENI